MRLLDVLMADHRGFASMLDVLEVVARRVGAGQNVPAEMLTGLLDFFDHFTDGHHRQEERLLFPVLAQHGIGKDQTVVNALLAQHEAGRMYTGKMRADVRRLLGGLAEGREPFVSHALGYVELIREHIRIEDSYFYRVAEEILSHSEKAAIVEAFSRESELRVPDADRSRYAQMVRDYPATAAGWQNG
ncbi:MAG: hemerythrin domain-containing protein [Vicinamibacterales bacterium]|nr:hemerythrin domain-containing protein [Vicinamibacterales bacterium]